MTTLILGWRRLYDALGFSTEISGPITAKAKLSNGKVVAVYIGPSPPLGIMSIEGGGYLIPGKKIEMLKTDTQYKAANFLEISITWPHKISKQQHKKLNAADTRTRDEILQIVQASPNIHEKSLDAISGVIGLRFHRQLVLKLLVEHAFFTGGPEPVTSYVGPISEILEGMNITQNAAPFLNGLIKILEPTTEAEISKSGSILHWLLKAWREIDHISKFMYLFIPLEAVLQSTAEPNQDALKCIDAIASIVNASDVDDRESLLEFLSIVKTKFGPTLNTRFEELAKKYSIPGWEMDVEAFKKFNRMRNLLLHTGNKNLSGHIDLETHTRTLEDLVERYVSLALLGTPDVYQSKWRPARVVSS